MSTIGTKLATEAAARLGTLIDAHAQDAGRQLGEWLRPCLRPGETLPDFSLALQLPARRIRGAEQRLRRDLEELDDATSHEGEARFRRDQTASALCRKLIEIRRLLVAVLGPRRAATLLGIEGRTARGTQPALLLSQAGAFLRLLRDPQKLATPHADVHFDPAAVAGALEPLVAACREARGELDEVHRANAARVAARDRARSELVFAVRCVVRLLGGWLLLIRRADLTEKLRPIERLIRGRQSARKEVPM